MRKRVQQQHDSVVVMEWQFSGRASPSSRGGGEVLEGRGCARCKGVAALPPLHYLYRPLGGCASPGRWDLQGAGAPPGPLYIVGGGRAAVP